MPGRPGRLLTVTQAAEIIGVHPNTLRAWSDKGMVPVTRLPSGYRRYSLEQVEQIQREMLGQGIAVNGSRYRPNPHFNEAIEGCS